MPIEQLRAKIADKSAVVAVIGLGYVGLPVASIFAQTGYRVIGLDINAGRVADVAAGRNPFAGDEPGLEALLADVAGSGKLTATTDYADLAADIVLICVETPVDADHKPSYRALRSAASSLGKVLKPGMLVIVESTVAPGTTDNVVRPLLEEASGLRANDDFYIATCPERVMPGKLLYNLRNMSRVCGGGTPETAETVTTLYRQFVHGDLDTADIITAELVKTTENAYRDVQIAFANEVAMICEANGADVWQVRDLVNKSPFRQMHLPGAGVGGHCIPKDPWLLVYSAADSNLPLRLIPAARAVNDYMPLHVATLLEDALAAAGRELSGARVLVLGYAYLEDSDDTRNSPTEPLVQHLRGHGVEVLIQDPFVSDYPGDPLAMAQDADAVIVMVRHKAYRDLDLPAMRAAMRAPILIDGRRAISAEAAEAAGFSYRLVGQGHKLPGAP